METNTNKKITQKFLIENGFKRHNGYADIIYYFDHPYWGLEIEYRSDKKYYCSNRTTLEFKIKMDIYNEIYALKLYKTELHPSVTCYDIPISLNL